MARKKTFQNEKGETVFERKMPEVGIKHLEIQTRPKMQKTPSEIDKAGVEKNLIAP
jgi:hypothetical protein